MQQVAAAGSGVVSATPDIATTMDEAAERTGTTRMQDDTPTIPRLPDDAIAEILLRLPAKPLFRSGAVCKAWRRITTDPQFLARARPQPASVILIKYVGAAPMPRPCSSSSGTPPAEAAKEDVALDALPVSLGEADRRRLIRYPKMPLSMRAHCRLLASCDGVLLFKKDDEWLYFICNPITRQWAELPRLPVEVRSDSDPEYAFYFHQPSGEFRILCCSHTHRVWYVVSTGLPGPRHVKANGAAIDLITQFMRPLISTTTIPVALHGNLHWPPFWCFCAPGSQTMGTQMMAFNTVSETFHQMPGPPTRTPTMVKLFEMGGLLAASDFGEENHVDLWFLEDYGAKKWECRHRIDSPWKLGNGIPRLRDHSAFQSVAVAGDEEGNIILGNNNGLVVYNVKMSKVVRTVQLQERSAFVSRHVFKGSLVQSQHACFETRPPADFTLIHSWS